MLDINKWAELYKKGYSLDIVYLLELADKDELEMSDSVKITTLLKTIQRKGLLSETNKVTLEGQELLKFVNNPSLTTFKKEKPKDDPFDKWWKVYPSTDSFEYGGKKFTGSRALKAKKDDCKIKLNAILNEGDYTIDDLIGALELEVELKKQSSLKEGKNKLSYMQNSMTYLNQRTFEAFIELYKSKTTVKKPTVYKEINI